VIPCCTTGMPQRGQDWGVQMGGHSMRGSAYSCWNGISVHRVFGNGSCCACYVSEICHRICNLAFSLHFEKIGKVGSLDTEVQA
jgi:hypothetical protein